MGPSQLHLPFRWTFDTSGAWRREFLFGFTIWVRTKTEGDIYTGTGDLVFCIHCQYKVDYDFA
jgi:hypothetical protein